MNKEQIIMIWTYKIGMYDNKINWLITYSSYSEDML